MQYKHPGIKKAGLIFWAGISLFLFSCAPQDSLEGLWIVEKVQVGEEERTPNGRWTRFHKDGTQETGNGGFQHTVGTWHWDENQRLHFENTNGLKDLYDGFDVQFKTDTMLWSRMEEGQEVQVSLYRAEELPKSYGDEVLGLWLLKEAIGTGPFLSDSQNNALLFLRWDKRLLLGTAEGKTHGVYNVNGHRREIEFIPYGETERSFWNFETTDTTLHIRLLNTDEEVVRSFIRTDRFPE